VSGKLNGTFIRVEVDDAIAGDAELAAKLTEVCPVDIFTANDGGVEGSAASAAMGSASDDDIETDEAASADPMALPPPPSPSASVTAAQVTKKAGTPKEKRTWPKRGVKK